MDNKVKAIIFDWGRTLYDSEEKREFEESEEVLKYCKSKDYKLGLVSLVTENSNATLEERLLQIEGSPLRKYFEITLAADNDKDRLFDQVVETLKFPRSQILIVDDRVVRGTNYANRMGHPSVWLQLGKFATERPNEQTGNPTHTIQSLRELMQYI
jgi:FMN phosphatase YigB (HAD superfamily)